MKTWLQRRLTKCLCLYMFHIGKACDDICAHISGWITACTQRSGSTSRFVPTHLRMYLQEMTIAIYLTS